MDIFELLPLLIFALLYLFGSSKKKEEEKKKKMEKARGEAPTTERKRGLQERLEEALQQMEQRIEAESAAKKGPREGTPEVGMQEEIRVGPTAAERERTVDADTVSNEIGRLSASTLFDRDIITETDMIDGGVVKAPGHSGFAVPLDQGRAEWQSRNVGDWNQEYEFRSLLEEVPNETYHGHGFREFREAHGIHYGEPPDPIRGETSRPEEFHEAARISRKLPASVPTGTAVRSMLGTPADLRRAIILAEILDRPVSQRRPNHTHRQGA